MRNFLIIVLGVILLNAALLYSGAFAYIKERFEPPQAESRVNTSVIDVFKATLETEVTLKQGKPGKGYTPEMFMAVYPGLTETDFKGVKSSIGWYEVVEGRLVFKLDDTELVHDAAGAITREGMKTLLLNVSSRTGIDLENGGTLTEIMSAITEKS